ncbi:MAG: hypothetical protein NZV14_05845 [Bryobacteraceae bacterium]|nr:hypothetical protein [Bryobacteraceae bacterium]MDW8377662.1 SpoIVB peptidase S55 domain-containing protein [Bryobacterales bacterium]
MVLLPALCLLLPAFAQQTVVQSVRAGQKGVGYTVFSGYRVEPFDVEILGVLENAGPKQSIILGKLTGGPLAQTGVLQGMSGSPVYVDGKLVGAVALAFSFAKESIAGIRPFEEMLEAKSVDRGIRAEAARCLLETCPQLFATSARPELRFGEARLAELATPVSFSGFTQAAIDRFSPQLRQLGLEPRQAVAGGRSSSVPAPPTLRPGSMISVQLVTGDFSIGADGTVTHIEGKRLYAFGHRFVSLGEVEMPFHAAEVLTLLPNLQTSFKISSSGAPLGVITHDYSTAVRGELGRQARMVPVRIQVQAGNRVSNYSLQMVHEAALTPFLLQMTTFSALDATERTLGAVAYVVKQNLQFENAPAVSSTNVYSGEFNTAMQAAQSVAIPVAYAMQSGFPELRIKGVELQLEAFTGRRHWVLEDVYASRRLVRAGEAVELSVVLSQEGRRMIRTVRYRTPQSLAAGPLQLSVSDGPAANLAEFRQLVLTPPKSAALVRRLLEQLRPNTNLYVRVLRSESGYQSQGEDLPAPPPSIAMLFQRSLGQAPVTNPSSKLAELEIPIGGAMVSGAKNVTVEVQE